MEPGSKNAASGAVSGAKTVRAVPAFMLWCPGCGVCLTGIIEQLPKSVECVICDTAFDVAAAE